MTTLSALLKTYRLLQSSPIHIKRTIFTSPANHDWYPKFYIKPIYQRSEQEKLAESGELQKLAYTPIRPPENDHTASVWHDPIVSKFINHVMRKGNKELARYLVEKTFETIKRIQLDKYNKSTNSSEKEKIVINPWEIFHGALNNARPILETTPVRRGGSVYQVPVPVSENRKNFLVFKWLIEASKDKDDDMRFYDKLAYELLDAYNNTGRVIKKKIELHKVCEANRAYAHYRWG